ncbi:hypothetical protein EV426DRAFT_574730 [Tirmania nivea]|nr:hypothetical protein EV426DRAFT_574730 [Tirmania nivea]
MKKYKVAPRTLFEQPTTVGTGFWGEKHNDVEDNGEPAGLCGVDHFAKELGKTGNQSTCPVLAPFVLEPADVGSTTQDKAVPGQNNIAEPISRSHKICLTQEAFKQLDKDLKNPFTEKRSAQLHKECANILTEKQEEPLPSEHDIVCTRITQSNAQENKIHLSKAAFIHFMDLANESLSPGTGHAELGKNGSICPPAPRKPSAKEMPANKPIDTLSLPLGRPRYTGQQSVRGGIVCLDDIDGVSTNKMLEDDGIKTSKCIIAGSAAIPPTSTPGEAQAQRILPEAGEEKEVKAITLHLKHILLSTLTKAVGELVLSNYEKKVDQFCHDAAVKFLEQKARRQEGLGSQMQDDMKGTQCEEFSGLVMRRWVLMMRLLERNTNKGKDVKRAEVRKDEKLKAIGAK